MILIGNRARLRLNDRGPMWLAIRGLFLTPHHERPLAEPEEDPRKQERYRHRQQQHNN